MSSFTRFLVSATIWLFSIWRSALLIFILLLSAHFIYKQTTLRVVPTPKTGENLSSKVHSSVSKAKIIPKAFTDIGKKKITKKESSKKLTNSTLREEPSDNKDISKGSVFSDFSNWIKEYQTFACSKPLNCLDHDPRLASSLVLRGKKIARARREVMASLISNNPQKAIELAIPQEVIKSLPQNITENLEKWQSGLIDVNTWHACSSQNHKLCKIEHRVTFNEDEHFEMYTYGQRKNLPSVKGLSAWGISLGNKFAMSDQAVLELSTNNMGGGELIFAGNKLSYDSPVEKNFFVELVQQAENRGRRSGGKLFYPISMGSNGTVQGYLREKYEIFFSEKLFLNITDQMPRHDDRSYPEYPTGNELTWGSWGAMSNLHFAGDTERPGRKLLQIESQAENDYIVYLINQHFGHIPSPTGHIPSPTKIWIGLTKDERPGNYSL
jgi:hypothetical protein